MMRFNIPNLVSLNVTLVLSCTSTAWAISSYTPSWEPPEFVGDSSYDSQTSDRFLAFDHYGIPAISRDTVSLKGDIYLDRRVSGLGWQSLKFGSFSGTGPSIAFDRHELPALSYGDSQGLHYAIYEPSVGTFTDYLVDDSSLSTLDWTLGGTSIAFDVYGRPAVAAFEASFGGLRFVTDSDGDGVLTVGDTLQSVSIDDVHRPSLAFDALNRPMIAGKKPDNSVDFFAKDYLGWGTTTISTTSFGTAHNGSLAIDPIDGLPAVAWSDPASSSLHYSKWNDATLTWDDTLLVTNPLTFFANASLAFDPSDGLPAISYSDLLGNIWLAYFDGATWQPSNLVLNTGFNSATRTSLAFNEYGNGFPAIAYVADDPLNTSEPLHYVYDPPAVIPEPMTSLLAAGMLFLFVGTRQAGQRDSLILLRM